MFLFKNWKKLYFNEKNNNKMLINQNSNLSKERIEAKKELAKVKLDLEDALLNLKMEKECSQALRKERTNLKRTVTILKKELKKDGE